MSGLKRCFSLYTKLGRWKIDHDQKIINIKIDQANRDNSGTSFEKPLIYKDNDKFNKDFKDFNQDCNKELHEFLLPYCM